MLNIKLFFRDAEKGCRVVFVAPSGGRFTCMLYKEFDQGEMETADGGSTFLFNITKGFGTD